MYRYNIQYIAINFHTLFFSHTFSFPHREGERKHYYTRCVLVMKRGKKDEKFFFLLFQLRKIDNQLVNGLSVFNYTFQKCCEEQTLSHTYLPLLYCMNCRAIKIESSGYVYHIYMYMYIIYYSIITSARTSM